MNWFSQLISYLFSMALVINAGVFVLQFARIVKQKNADGVSLWAFSGFLLIQLVTISYGFINHDLILAYGTLLGALTCTAVIVATAYYQSRPSNSNEPCLNEIIANIPANVYWMDRNGRFLGCNNQMLELLQLSSVDEYRGKTYEDLYEAEHIDIIKKTDQAVMSSDTATALEEVAHPYKVYWSNKIPLHNSSNDVIGLLGVSIDITDRKQMEKTIKHERQRAEAANQAKTEFIYNIRHDIRTPLTNMVGLADILSEQEQEPTKKQIVDDLLISSQALLDLFNDLLTFTNLEDNAQPIQLKPLKLIEISQQIQSIMSAALHSKAIKLHVDIASDIPESLISDPMRIHRILLNLVGNAIKFTDKGQIKLRFNLVEKELDSYWVALHVEDQGIGIPDDKLHYIFGKFNRIEQSANSHYPGSGLGLAIVRRFVDDLGGHIRVSSQLGQGSTFTCTLPFKPLSDQQGCQHAGAAARTTD